MEESTNTNLDCLHSTRFASHLAQFELLLWVILFILGFVLQDDKKDLIWVILIFLVNTSMEIYGLNIKNFYIILSCGLSRLCLSAFGNLAVILLAFLVCAMMEEDQLIYYVYVGVPISVYNAIKAMILFKAAHRIRKCGTSNQKTVYFRNDFIQNMNTI